MNNRFLPFVALAVALGIFFGYVNPTWSGSIADARAAIVSYNQALAAAQAFAEHEKELAADRDAMDPEHLERLALLLPNSVNNIGKVIDLNALAARSGLKVSSIDVAPGQVAAVSAEAAQTGAPPEQSIDFSFVATGTYESLKTLLQGIEKSARLLDVQELSIQGSDTGVYTYRMRIRLYWLR